MAGCFGNNPIGKEMENQLNRYLDEESKYDEFVDSVLDECIAGNEAFDEFLNSSEADKIYSRWYNERMDFTIDIVKAKMCAHNLYETFLEKPNPFKEERDV